MNLTRQRDTLSRGDDGTSRYVLRAELFDQLMSARGFVTMSAQARECGVPKSTLSRLMARTTEALVSTAIALASGAQTTVEVLFEKTAGE